MYIHIGPTGPIRCSKCGSTNAVNPVNEPDVDIRCGDCGHAKTSSHKDRFDDLLTKSVGTSVYEPSDEDLKF